MRPVLALIALLLSSPACAEEGGPPLRPLRFVAAAKAPPGHAVVSDMVSFRDRLYLATSANPLQADGARLLSTEDGSSYRTPVDDPHSQGFLRVRVVQGRLFAPDGDPQGLAPGRIWTTEDGVSFRALPVADALHSFDVTHHQDRLLASSGMLGNEAALSELAGGAWTERASLALTRVTFLVQHRGSLLGAVSESGPAADYVRWTGDVGSRAPRSHDVRPGAANTFRWFASSRGRLFWSVWDAQGLHLLLSDDGEHWTPVPGMERLFVSDLAELDGALYALTSRGLYGSRDHEHFELVAPPPEPEAFRIVRVPGGRANGNATGSLAVHRGRLWAGSSRGGRLYRLE